MQAGVTPVAARGTLVQVSPKALVLAPVREGERHIERRQLETAEFVALQPVLVYRTTAGVLAVIDGWRRVLAARAKGVDLLDVWDLGTISEELVHEYVLKTGLATEDRDPIRFARQMDAYAKLRPELKSSRAMGLFLGCSHSKVQRFRSYLSLSLPIQEQMAEGRISVSAADVLKRVEDEEVQAMLAEGLSAGTISREKAEEVASATRVSNRKPRAAKATVVAEAPAASMQTPEERWASIVRSIEELSESLSNGSKKSLITSLRELADLLEKQAAAKPVSKADTGAVVHGD